MLRIPKPHRYLTAEGCDLSKITEIRIKWKRGSFFTTMTYKQVKGYLGEACKKTSEIVLRWDGAVFFRGRYFKSRYIQETFLLKRPLASIRKWVYVLGERSLRRAFDKLVEKVACWAASGGVPGWGLERVEISFDTEIILYLRDANGLPATKHIPVDFYTGEVCQQGGGFQPRGRCGYSCDEPKGLGYGYIARNTVTQGNECLAFQIKPLEINNIDIIRYQEFKQMAEINVVGDEDLLLWEDLLISPLATRADCIKKAFGNLHPVVQATTVFLTVPQHRAILTIRKKHIFSFEVFSDAENFANVALTRNVEEREIRERCYTVDLPSAVEEAFIDNAVAATSATYEKGSIIEINTSPFIPRNLQNFANNYLEFLKKTGPRGSIYRAETIFLPTLKPYSFIHIVEHERTYTVAQFEHILTPEIAKTVLFLY